MSGADEHQRDTSGRRGWWLVGSLAVIGAVAGAFAGHRIDPDVQELAPSLAVAGLGLGGVIGLLLLAPAGLWRARRRRAHRRALTLERADGTGRVHTPDPEPAAELPVVAAPTGAEAAALTPQEQPEPEREELPAEKSEPEPQEPPPPAEEEPGWYLDPRDGARRYWDGHAWTGHVWRGRERERTRKPRGRP